MRARILPTLPLLWLAACAGSPANPPAEPQASTHSGAETAEHTASATPENEDEEGHYTLPGLNHGLIQSPVNILTSELHGGASHSVKLNVPLGGEAGRAVRNEGHTVQVDLKPGRTISFDGRSYAFAQVHFHTPSEHQIDGVTYPLEAHVVALDPERAADESPEYLVVSLLFKMGAENRFLSEFLAAVPDQAGETAPLSGRVCVMDAFDEKSNHEGSNTLPDYFTYQGSLTTPPFTESVRWLILRDVLQASPAQVQTLNALEGDNARHVQALFNREVEAR